MSFAWILHYRVVIATGLLMTVMLSTAGAAGGIALGVVCNRIRLSRCRGWHLPVNAFIEFIRNTPFLIQLFFIFFGLPALGLRLPPIAAAFGAMVLNVGAYSAEIIRAGLDVTPRGQIEGALSLGLSRSQTFWHVQLLPAIERTWPALSSQLVLMMLGSAVVSQIAVEDLSYAANFVQSRNFRAFETYFFLTLAYLALSIAYRFTLAALGRRIFPRGFGA